MIELLQTQTTDVHGWTNKLIENFPEEKWFLTPDVLDTNLAWQIGHLVLFQYYYSVVLIRGLKNDLSAKIGLQRYFELFANGERKHGLTPEISIGELQSNLKLVQAKSVEIIAELDTDSLLSDVVPVRPHPFVKSKKDSLCFNTQHVMWHCGQIGILKRIVDKPFDFGV